MACTRWRRHKHKECPSWRLFSSSGSLYTEFEKKIMGAGLLLVSWILRASLISVILEQSEFSLAAVPGSEDLNVNVTKMAVFCPQILYFGLSSQKYQPQEIWKSANETEGGSREGNTNIFLRSLREHTRDTRSISRARRNTTRCRKEQNVFRQTPVLPSILKTGPYHLRTSLLQGQDRVKGLLKLIQGNVLGLIRW